MTMTNLTLNYAHSALSLRLITLTLRLITLILRLITPKKGQPIPCDQRVEVLELVR